MFLWVLLIQIFKTYRSMVYSVINMEIMDNLYLFTWNSQDGSIIMDEFIMSK